MPDHGWGNAVPVFRVASVAAAIEYYVGVLGFHVQWGHEGYFASVARDRCNLFLCEGDQGHPGAWTWIGVNDAAALEVEFRAKGAKLRHTCTNYAWALEIQVEDLDGNVLRFGSDALEDQPFGDWLDMNGKLWPPDPDAKIIEE